ncbi:MAG TPA: SRPBCC family protein [Ilumatobacteraceae bacterium]
MDLTASLDAPCAAERLFELVDDLSTYPQWNGLVYHATREPGDDAAWDVELRARIGPLARSKRLRMIRTVRDADTFTVRFERDQADGRNHSPWVLDASIVERDGVSTLTMDLHYGGRLWTGGALERALAEQITSGRQRLLDLVAPTR